MLVLGPVLMLGCWYLIFSEQDVFAKHKSPPPPAFFFEKCDLDIGLDLDRMTLAFVARKMFYHKENACEI